MKKIQMMDILEGTLRAINLLNKVKNEEEFDTLMTKALSECENDFQERVVLHMIEVISKFIVAEHYRRKSEAR